MCPDDEVGGLGRDGSALGGGERLGAVHTRHPRLDAGSLVGCDGERGAVRKLAEDGVIAWAAAPGGYLRPPALRQALSTWFGPEN